MTILTILIVGGLVGWIASQLLGRQEGVLASILIGIVGSFIGSLVSMLVTGSDQAYLAFSWQGVIWSLVGSVILVAIMNAMSSRRHHPTI